MNKDKTIRDQAKVIKELWGELQTLKRILIDEYPLQWRDIQTNYLRVSNKSK